MRNEGKELANKIQSTEKHARPEVSPQWCTPHPPWYPHHPAMAPQWTQASIGFSPPSHYAAPSREEKEMDAIKEQLQKLMARLDSLRVTKACAEKTLAEAAKEGTGPGETMAQRACQRAAVNRVRRLEPAPSRAAMVQPQNGLGSPLVFQDRVRRTPRPSRSSS